MTEAIAEIVKTDVEADALPYIDDTAGLALPDVAELHYQTPLDTIRNLGLDPALDKCVGPSTCMIWIGVVYDSVKMTMAIDPEKVQEALQACEELLSKSEISVSGARVFSSRLLDMLSSKRLIRVR